MLKIIGISGSLRMASFNAGLMRAATNLVPDDVQIEIASIDNIPLYNADLEEKDGVPASVEAIKQKIIAADALLLATPEYNHSIPGVFKNAIDWLSRPPADISKVFAGRKVALMGASPSRFGTLLSQTAWLQVFRTLKLVPFHQNMLLLSGAHEHFDENGNLTDEGEKQRLAKFLQGFVEFCRD